MMRVTELTRINAAKSAPNPRSCDTFAMFLLVALVTVLLFLVLRMPLSRLDVPYTFLGDAVEKLTQVKTVAETGWLFHNERLGYPFGYDRLDFPRFDSLNYMVMGPLAALTGEAGAAMNLYFLASFYLIALSAFYCLRRLGFRIGPALICALIYAFLPYHLVRGTAHVTNGAYFLIPPAMLVLIRLAQNHIDFDTADARRRWFLALVVAVLLPLQTPYNGVFFALLCIVAGAIALAQGWHSRKVLVTLSLLAATGCTFMVEQIPRWMYIAEKGKVASGDRPAWHAKHLSMQLHQVVLPTEQHRLGIVRDKARDFNEKMRVPQSEVRSQYIGILGVCGLGALMWALFRSVRPPPLNGEEPSKVENAVRVAALLAIGTILISVSTGFGTLIAHFVAPNIRAYNRALPFLAFACLIGGGWALQAAAKRIGNRMVVAALCAVLLFDSLPRATYASRGADIAEYDMTREYFSTVEERLGKGAAVFQLPVIWYPENPPFNRWFNYDDLKPFLLTNTLRFSAGSGRERVGYAWARLVEQQPASEIVARTHAMGFSAILIDTYAYSADDLRKTTDALAQLLPEAPSSSPDRRWWTFPLKGCCGTPVAPFEPGKAPDMLAHTVGGKPIRFTVDGTGSLHNFGGWHPPERWGTWTDSEARLRINIVPAPVGSLRMSLDTRMMVGPNVPKRTLSIQCNDKPCGEFVYTLDKPVQQLQVALPSGLIGQDGKLDLRFLISPAATPKAAGVNDDGRSLGLGLTQLIIAGPANAQ